VSDIGQFIRNSHSSNPESIHQRNEMGLTPVFMAVFTSNLAAVRSLLGLGVDADLRDLENIYRWTPLVGAELISANVVHICYGLRNGSREDQEQIVALLKGAMVDEPKANCTCSSCEDGWLSQKMRVRLQVTASSIMRAMFDNELRFGAPSGSPLSDDKVLLDPYLHYLPAAVQKRVFITFYRGYHGIIRIIGQVLSGQEGPSVPYLGVVRKLIPATQFCYRYTRASDKIFYLGKDGRIIHALDCLIGVAEKGGDAEDIAYIERAAQMPDCANDGKFDLVRRKVGLWGYLPDLQDVKDGG